MEQNTPPRILRLRDVKKATGLSRSTIYSYVEKGGFPSKINIGPRSVGWLEHEVLDWIRKKVAASRSSGNLIRTLPEGD